MEEGFETQELKEKMDEAREHAEHAGHGGGGAAWILYLSLSTALIAVFAAVASLESGSYANDAIVQKNESILNQARASDQWAYFQAKGIKAVVYTAQSEAMSGNPEVAAKFREDGKREKHEQAELSAKAKEFEKKVEESDKESEHSLHIHHQFAKAVTIFQVAIALAAIAALTRKRAMWMVSLAGGALGLYFFALGFM